MYVVARHGLSARLTFHSFFVVALLFAFFALLSTYSSLSSRSVRSEKSSSDAIVGENKQVGSGGGQRVINPNPKLNVLLPFGSPNSVLIPTAATSLNLNTTRLVSHLQDILPD